MSHDETHGRSDMSQPIPKIRLHLWLEAGNGLGFGLGRALLLQKIDRHGSLRKAAEELGMSYRAAWGKIKKSEEVLDTKLIVQSGSRREGCRLTDSGRQLMESYLKWFQAVEREALVRARELLPMPVRGYQEKDP
jgi:molybdate transport system regulatory protein